MQTANWAIKREAFRTWLRDIGVTQLGELASDIEHEKEVRNSIPIINLAEHFKNNGGA